MKVGLMLAQRRDDGTNVKPTYIVVWEVQWNLSVTTTSIIKLITYDLVSNVF